MHTLYLSPLARSRLSQQITQNGVFVHTLYGDNGVNRATAAIAIEQCGSAVSMRVELGDSINSVTFTHRENTGECAALFLEELANGVTTSLNSVDDEHQLMSILGSTLCNAVRQQQGILNISMSELDKRMLSKGIAGWRSANVDIDAAIESQNWGAIEGAQNDRSLHANTIALIFHKYTDAMPKQGLQS